MNLNDAIVKDFNVGDIFVSKKVDPILVLSTGYNTHKYYIGGNNGFMPWSNQSGVSKEELLNYLNASDFVLSRNINEEIKKSLKFCNDKFKNLLPVAKKVKEAKEVKEKVDEKVNVKSNCPNGYYVLHDIDKIQDNDYVIYGADLGDKVFNLENYSKVKNSQGKLVSDAKKEWNNLSNLQWIRMLVN